MLLDETTEDPFESRKVKIVIHNLREASFVKDCERRLVLFYRNQENKIEYKCEIFKAYKSPKYYQNVLKYEDDLVKNFKDKEEFIETMKSFYETVCITINNESHLIDVDEIINPVERYELNVLSDATIWPYSLKTYDPSGSRFESKIPDATFKGVELFVYNFIKTHSNRMKKTIYDMTHDKYEYLEKLFEWNIKKIEELIVNLLGFADKDALESYSNECKNPIDIVNEFNRLSRKHQNMAFFEYKEIHFHLVFLILLSKSKHVKEWHSDMQCTRLSTFIQQIQIKGNKTSTGYCDVFYVDNENNEYLIELKYMNPKNKENLNEKKIEAIDQARSYQIENRPKTQCFAAIFYLLENQGLLCHIAYLRSLRSYNNGFQAYRRQSRIKIIKINNLNELKNVTEDVIKIIQFSNSNDYVGFFLDNKLFCIDADELKYLYFERTDLKLEEFWEKKIHENLIRLSQTS